MNKSAAATAADPTPPSGRVVCVLFLTGLGVEAVDPVRSSVGSENCVGSDFDIIYFLVPVSAQAIRPQQEFRSRNTSRQRPISSCAILAGYVAPKREGRRVSVPRASTQSALKVGGHRRRHVCSCRAHTICECVHQRRILTVGASTKLEFEGDGRLERAHG